LLRIEGVWKDVDFHTVGEKSKNIEGNIGKMMKLNPMFKEFKILEK
jgi:hypothetical protein